MSVDNITVDTGFDNNDFLTSSTSYTLHGTLGAELGAGEYVQVSMDGGNYLGLRHRERHAVEL